MNLTQYKNIFMDILQALQKQKEINPYIHRERIICDDGMLSISDAVFECTMYRLGFDKKDHDEWLLEPVHLRGEFIRQWNEGIK